MIRRLLPPLALLAIVVSAVPATHASGGTSPDYVAPQGSGALFLVTGHGYGHGVGMGQWGAEGYALHDYTYDQILAAYYPGTDLTQTTVRTLRVLLADGQRKLTVSSDRPIAVVDGDGASHTFPAGNTTLTASSLPYPAPLTLSPAKGSTLTLGKPYRGKFVLSLVDGKLRAINFVSVQQYVESIVTVEMSPSWKPDALEAQAVATRSYALAGRRPGVPWDVTVSGQSYYGADAETPEGNAAVTATKGQVLTYDGKVATTVYSSSTGGWTQSAADAWGGSTPYLVSVKDPYDTVSPWHGWGPLPFTAKDLGTALGISGKPVDATVIHNSSHRVAQLVVSTRAGDTQVPGTTVAGDLSLRSTFFSVGVMLLQAPSPNPTVSPGTTVMLGGTVRGLKNITLQQRPLGGAWSYLKTVVPDAQSGAVRVNVTPDATTDYRLAIPAAAGAWIRIRVSS